MDEREKDNLGDTKSNGYSIENIDKINSNDEIIQIDDDIDYDEEYMTNVSNNLVEEVDKVLNANPEEEEVVTPEETHEVEKPLPHIDEEVKEEKVVHEEPKEEEPVKVDDVEKGKSFEDLRREEQNNKSFEELRREEINDRLEKKNQNVEKKINVPSGDGKYLSYENRVIRYALFFALFFVSGLVLMLQSINFNKEEYINYAETSVLDYKVYLKQNDFYQEKYLEKGMLYVASLIDHIDIDFLYNFNIDEKVNLDFKYNIVGKLSITDSDGKNVYLTRDYTLLEDKEFKLVNEQDHTIQEKIVIDYGEYNKIANSFKSTYGLDTASKLNIYLNVEKKSDTEAIKDIANDNNMLIQIPLSQRSVSISMDYKDINRNSKLVKSSSITVKNVAFIVVSVVLLLVSFYGLYNVLKLLGLLSNKRSAYDKYIAKMMRQYDRLIVKHYTCPDLSNYNVIKIREFNELLDMRDNLKVPIMFYNVTDHQKSYFYIVNNNDLYLLVLKAVDFEK